MRAALFFVLAMRLAAQPACALRGSVVDSTSGKPVTAVKVFAQPISENSLPAYERKTGAGGDFCFERLAPGTYRVMAQHTGYLDAYYGAMPGSDEAMPVEIAAGVKAAAVKLNLVPRAILSGTVLHADGRPAPGSEIMIWRRIRGRDGPGQDDVSSTEADDRGMFRISDLPPGTYYLSAQPDSNSTERHTVEYLNDQGRRTREQEAETWFPNALGMATARPLVLEAGREIGGLTLTLRKTALRRISGRVAGDFESGTISLDGEADGQIGASILVRPDGTFERGDLVPGKYRLELHSGDYAHMLAEQEVDLTTADAEGLTIEPRQPFSVDVVLRTEGGAAPVGPADFWINLTSPRRAIPARAASGGGVQFQNVPPGVYSVEAQTNGAPYYLKGAAIGGEARDPAHLDLTTAPAGPIELLFSPHVARVEGRVNGKSGAVTTIVLEETGNPNHTRRAHTTRNGAFHIEGIKPGKYRVYAVEGFEEEYWGSAELATALPSAAVELGEDETGFVTVPLVTADQWSAAVERAGR